MASSLGFVVYSVVPREPVSDSFDGGWNGLKSSGEVEVFEQFQKAMKKRKSNGRST